VVSLFLGGGCGESNGKTDHRSDTLRIEAEAMSLRGPEVWTTEQAAAGKAVRFQKEGDRATTTLFLEKGTYQVRARTHGPHSERDAVRVAIAGEEWRFYYTDPERFGMASSNVPNQFSVPEDGEYTLELLFSEPKVAVDWVEISPWDWAAERMIEPPPLGNEPSLVSTFTSLSIYWKPEAGGPKNRASVEYRKTSAEPWRDAQALWYDDATDHPYWPGSYRGSIVGLAPGTTYEVRLTLASGRSVTVEAETWSETSAVQRLIEVDGGDGPYVTTTGGDADG